MRKQNKKPATISKKPAAIKSNSIQTSKILALKKNLIKN